MDGWMMKTIPQFFNKNNNDKILRILINIYIYLYFLEGE